MLGDPRNPNSLSTRFRRRRDVRLRALIAAVAAREGRVRILDLGGTVDYWERVGIAFLKEHRASVTIINFRATELGDRERYAGVLDTAVGDACAMPQYGEGEFELVHSNSVIEHVHTWDNMKAFAAETRRLGRNYYVQTPYFWFPIDPHFYRAPLFHWFPRPIRARMLMALPINAMRRRATDLDEAYRVIEGARLLDGQQFRHLFPDAQMSFERVAGLPKSMIAVRQDGKAESPSR